MSAAAALETTCIGCGADLTLEMPEGDSVAARWVRGMMRRSPKCDPCIAKAEAADAAAQQAVERTQREERCGLPVKLRGVGLGDLEIRNGQQKALAALWEWAETKEAAGLMLTGPTGRGKTRLATAACWTRLSRSSCAYLSVARAMAKLGASFSDESRAAALHVLSGSGAVVLDDLDKSRPTDFGIEQIFAAVDAREQAGAPLLVTTNLTPSEIGKRYGEPLMSRLAGYCRVVKVEGPDWRVAPGGEA
ncbi:MAG TPA: ATP-binding protein [Solirubrobacterales bacterium]